MDAAALRGSHPASLRIAPLCRNRRCMTQPAPTLEDRLRRLKFRAWHRGTREADYMIGGFFDRYAATWGDDQIAWYEIVVEEDDVDIMAWALGTGEPPAHLNRPEMIAAMRRLDYIPLP